MRFQLHAVYKMTPTERERLGVDADDDYGSVLEDTTTGETWMDGGEPEDQYFNRDWRWVPALLNTLAAETEAARQERDEARAEIARLHAERLALMGAVEAVDLEEVLRLDHEATQAPWRSCNAAPFKESIPLLTTDEIGRPMVRWAADDTLIVVYRTAAPALARQVVRLRSMAADYQALAAHRESEADALRAVVRCADEQGAEAIDRVSRAIVADKWNSTARLQEEVKRLTAELEEARRGPGGVLAEVAAERARQVVKGYTAEHDDEAVMGELAQVAALVLLDAYDGLPMTSHVADNMAFHVMEKYDRRRQLIIALAMGLAEVERLDRMRACVASTPPTPPE